MPLNETIVDTISVENLKTVAGSGALDAARLNQANSNHHSRLNQIAETQLQQHNILSNALTAKAAELLIALDPAEARSMSKVGTGDDLADRMSSLLAAINSGQQQTKSAQTTPPVTP